MAEWFIESEYQHIGDIVMQKTMSWVVEKHVVQILVLQGIQNIIKKKNNMKLLFLSYC